VGAVTVPPPRPGVVAWFTGLPASGKSTLAAAVRDALAGRAVCACLLDGDEVRAAILPPPGFTAEGRDAFYATLAALAALLARQGLVVIVSATAHRRAYRDAARAAAPRFVEVYLDADVRACAARDTKGLYAAARDGALHGLPGVDVPYQPPERPDVIAAGGQDRDAVEAVVRRIVR
jgi:adenylylsulfate kinase